MVPPPLTPHDRIFREFDAYLLSERGLAPKSIVRHLPVIRRFLHEVCPGGADNLCKISQGDVTGYIKRHARDWSPKTGKAMCSSLRAFLRYLHHQKLNPCALADCAPSIRGWKLATLPTYLSAAQVRKALDVLRESKVSLIQVEKSQQLPPSRRASRHRFFFFMHASNATSASKAKLGSL
jgi:site-specific recombinase XerD